MTGDIPSGSILVTNRRHAPASFGRIAYRLLSCLKRAKWDLCSGSSGITPLCLIFVAVHAAAMLDAICDKGTREEAPRLLHAEALANALNFDMATWFTPTAANYFGRMNRNTIMDALTEAGRSAQTRRWAKLKKGELAVLVEQEIACTGRLPQPWCPSNHSSADSDVEADLAVAAE